MPNFFPEAHRVSLPPVPPQGDPISDAPPVDTARELPPLLSPQPPQQIPQGGTDRLGAEPADVLHTSVALLAREEIIVAESALAGEKRGAEKKARVTAAIVEFFGGELHLVGGYAERILLRAIEKTASDVIERVFREMDQRGLVNVLRTA